MSGDALRSILQSRPRRAMAHPRRAAVLVALIDDGGPLRLLLTRRTETLPTHRGQVAFPGGGIDARDDDATAAALREAHEEVGLGPEHVEVLGPLDDFPTIRGAQIVTPIVGRVTRLPPLVPAAGEVARIFEVPIDALRETARWRTEHFQDGGQRWPVFFFDWDGEVLWGLSAYITLHLLDVGGFGTPFALPDLGDRLK